MRRAAALLVPLLVPMALLTSGCDDADNPIKTFENSSKGNVGGITPQDLKDGAEEYQTDLSGLDGVEGAPTDAGAPSTPTIP